MKDYSEEIAARQIRLNKKNGSGNENIEQEVLESALGAAGELSLQNPATDQAMRIAAFFKGDPDVTTSYSYFKDDDTKNPTIQIFVSDPDKADYLNRMLRKQYSFGGIILDVQVVQACAGDIVVMNPPSDSTSMSGFEMLKVALKSNPNLVNTRSVFVPLFGVTYNFLEFKASPLFYQADDISNVKGYKAVMPEELAAEIFDEEKVGALISTYVADDKK